MFIKLTNLAGIDVFLNFDLVSGFHRDAFEPKTVIHLTNQRATLEVVDDPQTIFRRLQEGISK